MWFQQDGARTAGASQAWLHAHFRNHYFGRGGIINWPPRSPDLNPLDYFVWAHVKANVYQYPVNDEDTLREKVTDCINEITRKMIDDCGTNFVKRLQCYVQNNGRHFEKLL